MPKDEQPLLFEGAPPPLLDGLVLRWTAPSSVPPAATPGQLLTQTADRVQHAPIEVLHHMEDTQLMLGFGPDRREHGRIQAGAIGHDDARLEAMPGELLQEPAQVLLVVAG